MEDLTTKEFEELYKSFDCSLDSDYVSGLLSKITTNYERDYVDLGDYDLIDPDEILLDLPDLGIF